MKFARPESTLHAACAARLHLFNARSRNSTGNRETREADEDGQDREMEELWGKKMIEGGLRAREGETDGVREEGCKDPQQAGIEMD